MKKKILNFKDSKKYIYIYVSVFLILHFLDNQIPKHKANLPISNSKINLAT